MNSDFTGASLAYEALRNSLMKSGNPVLASAGIFPQSKSCGTHPALDPTRMDTTVGLAAPCPIPS